VGTKRKVPNIVVVIPTMSPLPLLADVKGPLPKPLGPLSGR